MSKTSIKVDTHNIISTSELEEILTTQVTAVQNNPSLSKILPPIIIHSAPGIGKSTIIKSVAEKLGVGCVDIRLAQIESVDIRGLPVPDANAHNVKWLPSSIFPTDERGGIIFLDELTAAAKDVLVAAYELILDRQLGGGDIYKVPEKWIIVAAGNRAEDRAVSTTMSSALANRFLHFTVEANAEEWVSWAQISNIHPTVMGFINYRPSLLFNMTDENLEYGWPSPRSWEKVSHMIDLYQNAGASEKVLRKIIYGLVGDRAGVEFVEFYKNNKNIDDVLYMMTDSTAPINIPDTADKKYALCSAMSYLLWRGKDPEDESIRIDGFFRISMKLTPDFATLAMTAATKGADIKNSKISAIKLVKHPKFVEWQKLFGKSITKHQVI